MKDIKSKPKDGCNCTTHCPCGEDCICTEDNRCSPECECWKDDTAEVTRVKKIAQRMRAAAEDNAKKADENLNMAKYQKAEFENYKKRTAASVENAFTEGRAYVIVNVLPVMDSLLEAMKVVKNPADREGIEILRRKFESILESIGLEIIPADPGTKFDPHIHNAVLAEKSNGPSGLRLEEWQKGYRLSGRVIRPSTVKVSE
jgi:molecular chaperone GrpE